MNENVKKVVARILKDIQVEMSDEFDKNFERQAFFSEKWQRRKSPIRNEGNAVFRCPTSDTFPKRPGIC